MSNLERKVQAIKDQVERLKIEIENLEREDSAGLLSPIEKMRLGQLRKERSELIIKARELLM